MGKEAINRQDRLQISGALLGRNTLLNLIGQGIPLVIGVVTIPFIVRGIGTERFGLLSLAWVVLGYFAIFDLGLGRATTKFVAEALGKGKREEVPRLVWTAVTVQAILGIIGGLVLAGVTPVLVERILNIPPVLIKEARTTFYLLALGVPIVLVSGSFSGVLEASQRFDLVNAVKIPASSLTYLLPLLGLLLGLHLPGIVALILLARLGALATFIALNLRLTPELKRYAGSLSLFPRLFSFGGWVTVSSIAGPVFTYLERFLIASFLSMTALTFYAVPYEIISRLMILPASIAITLFPAFSYAGIRDHQIVKELFSRSFKYLLFIMTPILIIFVVFADGILNLWLGGSFAQESATILQLLTVVFFLNAFAHTPLVAIQGLGRPDLKAKLDLIMLPTFVTLCWWFIPMWGLVGAVLVKMLITLFDVLYLTWKVKGLLRFSMVEMFGKGTSKAIIITGAFVLAALSLGKLFDSLLTSIVVLSGLVIIYISLFIRIVMDDKDKAVLQSILRHFQLGGGQT